MSIGDRYKIPVDAIANVHSVSAVGEQYLDLVSPATRASTSPTGQTITKGTVPSEIGPRWTRPTGLAALPADKIPARCSTRRRLAVGGLGPSLQRLVDRHQAIARRLQRPTSTRSTTSSTNSAPILDSQVNSGERDRALGGQPEPMAPRPPPRTPALRNGLQQAAPTADQLNAVFSDVRESLPQTLANLEIMLDMLKRYHKGVEQALVFLPQGASVAQTVRRSIPGPGFAATSRLDDQSAATVPDRVPARSRMAVRPPTPRRVPAADGYCTARSRRTPGAMWFAVRATTRARICRASGRPRRRSAAATSPTRRWAPTPGTATPTRS